MAMTKRQVIKDAFEELGLAEYAFDLSPENIQSASRKLDNIAAMWEAKGIRVGLPMGSSDLDTEMSVGDAALFAMIMALAVRLAPSFGKSLSPDTQNAAKQSYDALLFDAVFPKEQTLAGCIPAGAGHKQSKTFLPEPDTTVDAGLDSTLDLE